jgi:antitoxin component of MazEF toxin-antitoxin module
MDRKLTKQGNSVILAIPPIMLEFLNVKCGENLSVTQEVTKKGEKFVKLTPVKLED